MKTRGTLFVANHVSYLDVVVLASQIDGIFVAKSEVRGWPLFGFLARISQTVFVSRKAVKIPKEKQVLASRLFAGDSIILFPEGSSSKGEGVLPFRPGLMSVVHASTNRPVPVQPVSLAYGPASRNKPACDQATRDRYAWYGDMDLLPHLWQVFGSSEGINITLTFHQPELSNAFSDARACAKWAEESVADGLRTRLTLGCACMNPETGVSPFKACVHSAP